MTLARKKYEENQKLMSNYVSSYPELKSFIDAFSEIQKANKDGRHVKLDISIGESKEDGFYIYLKNRIENPRITFSSFKEKNGDKTPQVIVTHSIPVCAFAINCVKIISQQIENEDDFCPFDRYNFTLNFADKFDYDITMVIYKE